VISGARTTALLRSYVIQEVKRLSRVYGTTTVLMELDTGEKKT